MNICTISTFDWLDAHTARWLRKIRENVPSAQTHLFLPFQTMESLTNEVVQGFDGVTTVTENKEGGYRFFDTYRMGATTHMGADEVLYIDADADVLADISDIPSLSDKPLLYCASPVMNRDWFAVAQVMGYGVQGAMANNGLLYLREDFTERYNTAMEKTMAVVTPAVLAAHPGLNKTMGLCAFNVMLLDNPDIGAALPDGYGVVWHQPDKWAGAKVIQYCNERGQEKHKALEDGWRAFACTKPVTS